MSALSDGSFSIGSKVWPGTSKLIEEMGELNQVLGKLIATHGDHEHWDGLNVLDRLHEEIADVQAALMFFSEANDLDRWRIDDRVTVKFRRFVDWHSEGDPPPIRASGDPQDTSHGD